MGVEMIAIIAEGQRERVYLSANGKHLKISATAKPTWIPDVALPSNPRDFKTPNYGMRSFSDLFTARQLVALSTFSDLVAETTACIHRDALIAGLSDDSRRLIDGGTGACAYADAVATYLGLTVSKSSDYWSNLCIWRSDPKNLGIGHVFARQAVQMIWDFAEANPFSNSSGNWEMSLSWVTKVIDTLKTNYPGTVSQRDATACLDFTKRPVVSTDPPYYDNIGYADLSDFFYVWLRQSLRQTDPKLFSTMQTPKKQELVATPYRFESNKEEAQQFFEEGLRAAFGRIHDAMDYGFPFTVYYAFKQTETVDDYGIADDEGDTNATASTGWETMLEGLVRSGFAVLGTWPIRTELGNRTLGIGTNALASSIVLVCRPRPADASLATRKQFLTALRSELPDALRNLQRGNIAPVDLAQAAIGPGMAVFSRFVKVMETDGAAMSVRTALGLINQALDEVLAEQEGEFDADTRWAVAWFEQFGKEEGPFGVAETLSKAKNTAINGLIDAGVVKARAGKVQLLKRDELPDDWNPATDKRITVWEVTQQLIRAVEQKGESAAATLLHQLGGMGETARDLAYRLYTICERKKWADEALAYNGLVIAWSELSKLALSERSKPGATQTKMFE
jgi:putative DNA methylase